MGSSLMEGEMESVLLMGGGTLLLVLGYLFYGKKLARMVGLGQGDPTPAHTLRDDVDYVPAKAPVLLGHHFASIAGAGPILGPIIAAQFGWMPVFLWLVLGGIFFGGMHDFMALVASARHEGRSVGTVIEVHLGKLGKYLFLAFSFATLILVVAVFTDVVARSFIADPRVASSSLLFIPLAVFFGFAVYRYNANFVLASIVGIALLGLCLYLGVVFPFPDLFADKAQMLAFWKALLLVYVCIASVVPVNYLLQPRDYLNSFLLYGVLLLGLLGIFLSPPEMKGDAFTAFHVDGLGYLFPMLFVTVACGAISGFHALVASGTTAKQLNYERDALPVGYGAMLIESVLGIMALITAVMITRPDFMAAMKEGGPAAVFYNGLAGLLGPLGIPVEFGVGFAGLAVSAFAMTSLDTATRLARFTLQEIFLQKDVPAQKQNYLVRNRYAATAVTVACSGSLLLVGSTVTSLWAVFGSANQLLAALALMAVTVWLGSKKLRTWYVVIPMVFMYVMTLTALGLQFAEGLQSATPNFVTMGAVVVLFVLAILLGVHYVRNEWIGKCIPAQS